MCLGAADEGDTSKAAGGGIGLGSQQQPGNGICFRCGPGGHQLSLDLAAVEQFPCGSGKVATDDLAGCINQLRVGGLQCPLECVVCAGAHVNLDAVSLGLQHRPCTCGRIDGRDRLLRGKSENGKRSRDKSCRQKSHCGEFIKLPRIDDYKLRVDETQFSALGKSGGGGAVFVFGAATDWAEGWMIPGRFDSPLRVWRSIRGGF